MKIETKLEFKDYLRLMYALTYKKPTIVFLSFVGLIMFVGSLLYFMGFNIPFDDTPYFQLILGFFIVGYLPFSIYRTAKKNFYSHGKLQEKMIYEFTTDKIKVTGATFSSEMDWSKTYKIKEINRWVLIYPSRNIFNLIPKDSIGENIDEFRSLIRTKNIKQKLKK